MSIEYVFPEASGPGPVPAQADIQAEALTVPARARGVVVTDQGSLDAANEFLQGIKRLAARIAETFDPQIARAHALHKSLLAEKKKFTEPLELAEKIVKPKITAYLVEQDRIRLEAERKQWAAEDKARKEAEKALEKAKELEQRGEKDKADKIITKAYEKVEAIKSAAPEVPEAPKAEGISLREAWEFEVVDANAIPREYMTPDLVKIGRIVRAIKDQTNIPGIRVWSKKTIASRTGIQN